MRLALADVFAMPPAARALLVSSLRNAGARFLCRLNGEIAQNEKFLQLIFVEFARHIGIRPQNNRRPQRIANQFFLTRLFDGLTDHATQPQKTRYLRACLIAATLSLRKFLQVTRGLAARMTPGLLGGKD